MVLIHCKRPEISISFTDIPIQQVKILNVYINLYSNFPLNFKASITRVIHFLFQFLNNIFQWWIPYPLIGCPCGQHLLSLSMHAQDLATLHMLSLKKKNSLKKSLVYNLIITKDLLKMIYRKYIHTTINSRVLHIFLKTPNQSFYQPGASSQPPRCSSIAELSSLLHF